MRAFTGNDDEEDIGAFIENAASKFKRTPLGLQLEANGVELHRFDVGSNYRKLHDMSINFSKDSDRKELTMMGEARYNSVSEKLRSGEKNMAMKGYREFSGAMKRYLDFTRQHAPAWSYWMDKGWDEHMNTKAAVETEEMGRTVAGYAKGDPSGFFRGVEEKNFEQLREPMAEVLEEWSDIFMSVGTVAKPRDKKTWDQKMKWNTNGAHPYGFSISRERFETIDWPNFREWVSQVTEMNTPERVAAYMETNPGTVPNANKRIYYMFHRSPDRVIHGVRQLLKPFGAMVTSTVTEPMSYGSGVAWKSVAQLEDEASLALADCICISADDLRKFDKSLHPRWFQLGLEVFWESDFLKNHQHMRNVFACLIHELAQESYLQVHASWRVHMRPGLPSGHPLTQWFGSWVHLALYKYWANKYSLEPTYQQVLSDDGIQFYNDVTPAEMAKHHENMQVDLEQWGMSLHPDKTKICDPTNEFYVGQLDGNEVHMHDQTYFLKRNLQRDRNASHGSPSTMLASIYETERSPSEKALLQMNVQAALIGTDQLTLGGTANGGPPRAVYDIARITDIITSGGRGNPLVEDYIHLVQSSWPGFAKRGVNYLDRKLDNSWRKGSTMYAGGTLDSGLSREWAVEALLNLDDDYKVWDEIVFR